MKAKPSLIHKKLVSGMIAAGLIFMRSLRT